MDFRLLGPLEVAENGRTISLGGARARALLVLLLLHRNEVVAVDRIVDALWSDQPPKTAGQAVRVYVSQLRKSLEPGGADEPRTLLTRGNGYVLMVDDGELDLDRFDALRAEGRRLLEAGEAARAAGALDEALSLWRGPPLQDFAYEQFAQSEIGRLEELRLATLDDRFEAELGAGRDSELVADLEQLVDANPLRERFRGQLMVALYRSGRQAEALEIYQRGRRLMVDELGLEPSETLRGLEARILQRDSNLDRPRPAAPPESPKMRARRRLRTPLVLLTLVGVAAIAGILVAATRGGSAGSLRVAMVMPEPRDAVPSDPPASQAIGSLRAAGRQLGFRPAIRYTANGTDFLRNVAAAARRNGLVIVGATPQLQGLSDLTREFPKTRFLVPDSVHDRSASFGGQQNVTGIDFHDYENGELGGYLSALVTRGKQTVSAVGGEQVPSVQSLIRGFKAGAQLARPDVRVGVEYVGTFTDQEACRAAAERQIAAGSVVVFDVAGNCGIGALDAAANSHRHVWGLGVDSNLSVLSNDRILASVVKHFGFAARQAASLFASGRLPGGRDLQFDLANHGIALVGINPAVSHAIRAKVHGLLLTLEAQDKARNAG